MIVAINPLCGQEVAQPSPERIKAVKALSVEDPAAVDIPLETQRLLESYQISSDQLATLVKSENWQVRQKAASKFYHYEEDEASDTVAEILKPLLLDPAWQVRSSAFFALHRNKQSAESALTEIVASLNDPSEQVRGEVFDLLQRMKEKVAPAKDHLIARLKEKKQETSSELIEVLGNIGPAAKEAIPHLKKLDYSSYQIRGIALGRMQARDELMELSDSMEGMGPYAAACGFGFLKNANQAVHNRLILLASQTHSELRRDAFLSMGKIRPASKVIAEKLIEGLTDKKGYVRGAAAAKPRNWKKTLTKMFRC